jgi:surface antigen
VTAIRIVAHLAIPALFLAACTATTGGGTGSTGAAESPAGGPAPVAGGLGANATGGLLAANSGGTATGRPEPQMSGRLLEGPYLIQLSKDDIGRAERAALTAFETTPAGQTTIWRNPGNGHWGTLTPLRTFQDASGRYCREYRQTVTIGGQEHQGNGSACREPDAVWRIMG